MTSDEQTTELMPVERKSSWNRVKHGLAVLSCVSAALASWVMSGMVNEVGYGQELFVIVGLSFFGGAVMMMHSPIQGEAINDDGRE